MKKEFAINDFNKDTDWKEYLSELDDYMVNKGFRKYNQNHKRETFAYWKKYKNNYQIGLLVYDWSDLAAHTGGKKVSIQFECMPIGVDCRCDLSVSKDDVELNDFELIAEDFYNAMEKHIK